VYSVTKCQTVVSSRCVELQLRKPAVRIQFVFLQQTAAGHLDTSLPVSCNTGRRISQPAAVAGL